MNFGVSVRNQMSGTLVKNMWNPSTSDCKCNKGY